MLSLSIRGTKWMDKLLCCSSAAPLLLLLPFGCDQLPDVDQNGGIKRDGVRVTQDQRVIKSIRSYTANLYIHGTTGSQGEGSKGRGVNLSCLIKISLVASGFPDTPDLICNWVSSCLPVRRSASFVNHGSVEKNKVCLSLSLRPLQSSGLKDGALRGRKSRGQSTQ